MFWKYALIRAVRTMAQTAVATIGSVAVLSSVDWKLVASATVLAGILSALNSVATGLPETDAELDAVNSDRRDEADYE